MNYEKVNELVISIGQKLLECGAEIHRAEIAMEMLLKKYKAEKYEVFTISSEITISSKFDGVYYTLIKRVTKYETNFNRLDKLNALCRKIVNEDMDLDDIQKEIDHILISTKLPWYLSLLGYVIATSSFAIFFGGDYLDAIVAGLICIVIFFLDKYLKKKINGLVYIIFVCAVSGSLGLVFCKIGFGHSVDKILIGDIMVLIPGITLTNSFRDLFLGDTISGTIRCVESLLTAICVAIGFGISMYIFHGVNPEGANEIKWYISMLTAILGTVGFGLIFHMRGIKFFFAVLGSLFSWGTYLIVHNYIDSIFFATFISAIVATFYGETMARIKKSPALGFLMPACVPLYPGAALYYSLANYIEGNTEMFVHYLSSTIYIIVGICSGIIITSVLFKYINRFILTLIKHLKKPA